jgi:hypothetical protein
MCLAANFRLCLRHEAGIHVGVVFEESEAGCVAVWRAAKQPYSSNAVHHMGASIVKFSLFPFAGPDYGVGIFLPQLIFGRIYE